MFEVVFEILLRIKAYMYSHLKSSKISENLYLRNINLFVKKQRKLTIIS